MDQEFWGTISFCRVLRDNLLANSSSKTLTTWVKHAGNRSTEILNGRSIRELSSTELKGLFNEVQGTEEVGSDNRYRINQALLLAAKELGVYDWDPVRSSKIKNGSNGHLLEPMQVKAGWPDKTEKEKGELVRASIKVGPLITKFSRNKGLEEMAKHEVSELFCKVRDCFPQGSSERSHVTKVLNRLAGVLGVHWTPKFSLSAKTHYLNYEYFIKLNDPATYSVKGKVKDQTAKVYAGASIKILKDVLDEIGIEDDLKNISEEVITQAFNNYYNKGIELNYNSSKLAKIKAVLSALAEIRGFDWVCKNRRKKKNKKVKAIKTSSSSERKTPKPKVKKEEESHKEIVMCKENKELFERMNSEAYWKDGLGCSTATAKTRRQRVKEIWQDLSTYIDLSFPIQETMESEMTSALSSMEGNYNDKNSTIKSNGKAVLSQLAIEAKVVWESANNSYFTGEKPEPIEDTLSRLEKKRGRPLTEIEKGIATEWYRYLTRAKKDKIYLKSNHEPYGRAEQEKRQSMARRIKLTLEEEFGIDLYAADVELPKVGDVIPLAKDPNAYTSGEVYTQAFKETYVQLANNIYGKIDVIPTGLNFVE